MLRRALLLKIVSWIVLSPALAQAEQLHCRADVRETMSRAWQSTANGTTAFEAAFLIRADGSIAYLGTTREYMAMHLAIPEGTIALFHTHPNQGVSELSDTDKALADKHQLVIYAITHNGLFQYSHPRGQQMLRPNLAWGSSCH